MKIEEIDKNFKTADLGGTPVNFYNACTAPFVIEGFAWRKDGETTFYRLPRNFTKDDVNEGALYLANNTSGGMIRFRTNSPYIAIRAKLVYSADMNHMPRAGSAGFDIYQGLSNIATYLLLFLLQAMPWVELGIVSIISIGLMKIIEFILFATTQKRVKEEYMLGKSIETSFDDAYKRTFNIVLDVLIICLVGGLSFAIVGGFELTSIGTIVALLSISSGAVLLLGVKLLTNCLFAFNSVKTSCYALPERTEGETNE